MIFLAAQGKSLVLLIHHDVAAAGDTAAAHASRDNGCVAGHAAADGQDTLCYLHAGDVFRGGLQTNQNNLLASCRPLFGILCVEDDFAACRAGRCAQSFADQGRILDGIRIKCRVKQSVEVSGLDHGNRLFLGSHALIHQIAGDLQSGLSGSLAVSGLQHVELSVLNGELHILHVAVMILKNCADFLELLECLRETDFHLGNLHRGTDTGHDVLALCVGQEFAEQALLAVCRVSRESDARSAVIAHIAECHGLNVDGSSPGIRDVVVAAVNIRTRVVPGTEHSLDGAHQLFLRIIREVTADLCLVLGLELVCQLLQVIRIQIHVLRDTFLGLHGIDQCLKILLADFHNDVGIHLDESAIAVPRPAGISGFCSQRVDNGLIQAQVQNRVHHAGHGRAGTGTDGNQKRILDIAELLSCDLFQLDDVLVDFVHGGLTDLTAILVILRAGFGRDGEALRNRQTDVSHLSQVRTLAAEQFTHVGIAFAEQINSFTHSLFLSPSC